MSGCGREMALAERGAGIGVVDAIGYALEVISSTVRGHKDAPVRKRDGGLDSG